MTNTHRTVPISRALLTALRDIEREPAPSMIAMRRLAHAQATLLRNILPRALHQVPTQLPRMIPSITVEYIAHLPVTGISYWADRRWHIHLRQEDPLEDQVFTALRQLKQIIDHPLRQQIDGSTAIDWDALADDFARQALSMILNQYQRKRKERCL